MGVVAEPSPSPSLHGESLNLWRGLGEGRQSPFQALLLKGDTGSCLFLFPCLWVGSGSAREERGGGMSTSWSAGAAACERFGSGGLGRPR